MWYKISFLNFKDLNQHGLRSKLKEKKECEYEICIHMVHMSSHHRVDAKNRRTFCWELATSTVAVAGVVMATVSIWVSVCEAGEGEYHPQTSSTLRYPIFLPPSLSLDRSLSLKTKWDFKTMSTFRLSVRYSLVWSTGVISGTLWEIK